MVTLPYANVDSSLRGLAGQAEGFGRYAIGGLHGPLYHVTTLADDGPGSLRDGCRTKCPLWIVFEVSGTICLSSFLSVSSYKTVDGRGQRIKLTGKGLRLKECEHVIVCNIDFEGGRQPDADAIQIKHNSKHIWIDRCSLRNYEDGLIDITRGSTDITVSRCHFSQHNKTMLIGADPTHIGDRCIRVTIHHCFFDGTKQQNPRVRFGTVHLYNNYTTDWSVYAVCASVESQIYSQSNIYEAGKKKVAFKYYTEKAADNDQEGTGSISSEGDHFIGVTESGLENKAGENMFHPIEHYPAWTVEAPSDALKHALKHCTGWQCIPRPNMVRLPYGNVDCSLRALAAQAEGFGRSAIGGLHGPLYLVTTLADDGPGSLRNGCRTKGPLWIVFEVSGTICLSSFLSVASYKTIDGRGQRIKLTGKGLRLKECEHVIVCNLEFEGGRQPDADAIQIKPNSKHIWIDRCSLRDYEDGLIDITRGSTDITVSRCHFSQHNKTMLIGADPTHIGDRCIRVTIHHCFFDRTRQRHPRVRFGRVHLYNNYTTDWSIYAVCASVESQIYSQCNIYEAGKKTIAFKYYMEKAADKEHEGTGSIRSEGDLFIGVTQSGLKDKAGEHVFHPSEHYPTWTMEDPSDALKNLLKHCTGWQCITRPLD